MKNNEKLDIANFMYIIPFFMFTFISVLYTTMFTVYIPTKLATIIRILSTLIVLIKIIIIDKPSLKEKLLYISIMSFLGIIYKYSGYMDIMYTAVFIIGAKNIKLKNIVSVYFLTTASIIVIAMICSKIGIIENIKFVREYGKVRESFGIIYPTDFAAHIFYLILAYFYIKNKVSYVDIIIFLLLSLFVYKYCDARLDTISIIISIVFILVFRNTKYIINKIKLIFPFALPISIIISIWVTLLYKYYPTNEKLIYLNKMLADRLRLGLVGIDKYGFSFFGKHVVLQGWNPIWNGDYFFIDSSYLLIALKYGAMFTILLCLLMVISCFEGIKRNDVKFSLVIALISINSIVAHHFLDLAYNPFILGILSFYWRKNKNIN